MKHACLVACLALALFSAVTAFPAGAAGEEIPAPAQVAAEHERLAGMG